MISKHTVDRYCNGDISKIENYDKAVADKDETWHCHHRAEILLCANVSVETLKKYDLYYNRNPEELIFLTHSEHIRLHDIGNKFFLGKKHSEESRMKISLAIKGNKNWLGKHHSAETKKKMSEAKKGIPRSTKTCIKMSEALKGRTFSADTRMKISQSLKGRKLSEEHRKKLSKSQKRNKNNLGKHHSKETRMKMSLAIKSYFAKKKMSKES